MEARRMGWEAMRLHSWLPTDGLLGEVEILPIKDLRARGWATGTTPFRDSDGQQRHTYSASVQLSESTSSPLLIYTSHVGNRFGPSLFVMMNLERGTAYQDRIMTVEQLVSERLSDLLLLAPLMQWRVTGLTAYAEWTTDQAVDYLSVLDTVPARPHTARYHDADGAGLIYVARQHTKTNPTEIQSFSKTSDGLRCERELKRGWRVEAALKDIGILKERRTPKEILALGDTAIAHMMHRQLTDWHADQPFFRKSEAFRYLVDRLGSARAASLCLTHLMILTNATAAELAQYAPKTLRNWKSELRQLGVGLGIAPQVTLDGLSVPGGGTLLDYICKELNDNSLELSPHQGQQP